MLFQYLCKLIVSIFNTKGVTVELNTYFTLLSPKINKVVGSARNRAEHVEVW